MFPFLARRAGAVGASELSRFEPFVAGAKRTY